MKRLSHILTAAFLLISVATMAQTAHVKVGGNVYGGGKSANVTGDTKVTVNQSGAVLSRDVYGGGALADVGTNSSNTTKVEILDGTITGDIYGGGLGDNENAAYVNGEVQVNIGKMTPATAPGDDPTYSGEATIGGSVYGCNNIKGSPKADVEVNIYKTAHNTTNAATYLVNNGSGDPTYAIHQVFGGGHQAHYAPDLSTNRARVHVYTCNNTIEDLFGGGDAANALGVETVIEGGRFNRIFGGGNGAGAGNPGANIGTGGVSLTITGGHIGEFFGGSNEKGAIEGPLEVNVQDGDCGLDIENFYCGSNMVPIVGDVKTTIHCNDNFSVTNLYGGSNKADITGNVELTIEGGTFTNVFGGSKGVDGGTAANIKDNTTTLDKKEGNVTLNLYGGTITNAYGGSDQNGNIEGKITVNVLDFGGSCALNVENIYGAGNLTAYTPNTSGITSPEVNVMHVNNTQSITGNVYGGAKGDDTHPATVTANPRVNIGYDATSMSTLVPDGHTMPSTTYAKIDGIVFGGGDFSPVAGNTTVTLQTANSSVSSLFGGGNQASVGEATVNVLGGNVSAGVYGGCNTSGTVGGAINVNIKSNLGTNVTALTEGIYGGGKGSDTRTSGNVTVTIGEDSNPTIYSDVYGGSALGWVGDGTGNDLTKVDFKNGTLHGNIYGGGMGQESPAIAAQVKGGVEVDINGGSVKGSTTGPGVYGGCNYNGTVNGAIAVNVNGGTIGTDADHTVNVHGGGYGQNTSSAGDVEVTINGASAAVWGDVYGGSALGNVNGTTANTTNHTYVTLSQGTVHGDLYGGGLGSNTVPAYVYSPVTVTVNGGTVNNVFGCNNENGAPKSTVQVNINNTVTENVYGGGNLAAYSGSPKVYINNGTVANVFGGGKGETGQDKAKVTGDPEVTVGDSEGSHSAIVTGNVYGGGDAAQVDGNTSVTYNDSHANSTVGKLFGGGNAAGVTGTAQVAMSNGKVANGVYGGCNSEGTVGGNITVGITNGTIGTSTSSRANVHGGGYGKDTHTSGSVTVNIASNSATAGPTIYGDLYGGSGFGQVSASDKLTQVNFYKGTINGDVYGGGLGEEGKPAEVSGNVEVNIHGGVFNKADGTLGGGRVFGCNNANGTPKGTVAVNIHGTDHGTGVANNECPAVGTITTAAQLSTNALTQTYAIAGVYGGGNLASYEPETGQSTTVHIYNCNNTIKDVFGGGNAANVGTTSVSTNTFVVVEGGRIDRVFGGGNGDPTDANIYGTASTTINAGLIGQIYGGNNLRGSITNTSLNLAKTGSCTDEVFGEVFGGANEAPITGTLSTTIACGVGTIGTMYGGSNKAKIGTEGQTDAVVNLTIEGGNYDYVFGGSKGTDEQGANIYGSVNLNLNGGTIANAFGGSNVKGNIADKITVNVEDKGSCDLLLTNVYGGGKDASYEPTDATQDWPEVNIKHIKEGNSVANVYGGGYGATAEVKSNPKVTIGDNSTSHCVTVSNNVYGGGEKAPVTGNTQVIIQNANTTVTKDVYGGGALANVNGTQVTLNSGSARMLFGGGMGNNEKAALVNGDANVTVTGGTVTGDKINTTGTTDVKGAIFGGCNIKGTVTGGTTVLINGAVGTTTNYVNVYGGGLGENTDVTEAAVVTIGANVFGDVYGGSAKGLVSGTTSVTQNNGTISGDIYGGGHGLDSKEANVGGAVAVKVNGGTVNNVYGANNVLGTPQSTVQVDVENGTVNNNVYGGGNLANYSGGSPIVNIKGGSIKQSVFGGGNEAGVGSANTTTTVNVTGGTVGQSSTTANPYGIYGGCNTSGEVTGAIAVNIEGGTLGTNSNKLKGVFGGGYGESTLTTGDVTVTIGDKAGTKTPTIYGDIYGGSALGKVNTDTDNLTKVDFLNGTLHGNIYGGGLGDADHDTYGQVNGKINVNIGAADQDEDVCHITLTGSSVYGCNNTNGTPKGDVTVNVYKTGHTDGASGNSVSGSTYAIAKVFGGGRNASFTETGKKATVNIYDCYNTVGWVFGGGDAADVPGAVVMIDGGHFDWVFGGGNGAGTGNPGANIGAGGASLTVHGGLIGHLFGGSNEKGDITGTTSVNIDNTGTCGEDIKEFFGGSNMVDITGNIETNIGCGTKFGTVYGGSNKAKITGNVTLNINGGTITNVFGGSKGDSENLITTSDPDHVNKASDITGNVTLNLYGGTIAENAFGGSNVWGNIGGQITVNVLDKETENCEPLSVVNIYGAGNMTKYTPDDATILSPEVNIMHIRDGKSISGNVFGGALGDTATVTANPLVTIGYGSAMSGYIPQGYGIVEANRRAVVDGNVYGGGDRAAVTGNTSVVLQKSNSSLSKLFGGGNQAGVSGTATVTMNDGLVNGGTDATHNGIYGGCNESGTVGGAITVQVNGGTLGASGTDKKAYVHGGGYGQNTKTGGNVEVTIGNSTGTPEIFGDVYGGSALGSTNGTSANTTNYTNVTLKKGTVHGDLYGGGLGSSSVPAYVYSPVTVTINGGIVDNVFGCNNENGAPQSTVQVNINETTANTMTVGNVYGGGNKAAYGTAGNDYPQVNLIAGTVTTDVFGGGLGSSATVTGNPVVNLQGGAVSGKVFGGGSAAPVTGDPQVNALYGSAPTIHGGGLGSTAVVTGNPTVIVNQTSGKTLTVASAFGGGDAAGVSGNTDVQLKAGSLTNAFGGGNVANITGTTKVTLEGATADTIFGGGNKAGVTSTATVNINSGSVVKGVYGGCNTSGTVGGAVNVYVNGGQVGTSASNLAYGVFGGGYGTGTGTSDDVTVTIGNDNNLTPTIYGNVYGGSAKGNVSATDQLTKVWLKKGAVTGDIYGGGFGDGNANALVNGNVQVVVDGGTVSSIDANNGGRVFGCNNVNGTPKGTVEVTINSTAATVVNGGVKTYALQGVYGGGNLAHYDPEETNNNYPKVTINGCGSSIKDLFGGGNAAAVPNTNVVVNGGDINRVFAGGNGESGTPAHVGYKNSDNTPATSSSYGTGKANATIKGGTIVQVFGGSNKTGVIRANGSLNIAKDGDCPMKIGEVYGGGNEADGAAGSLAIGCTGTWTTTGENNHTNANLTTNRIGYELEGIGNVYGGANKASISGNIALTISSGIINNVFGGNNQSGSINGTIQVDINKSGSCDWYVGNVYGGGNIAGHEGASTVNIMNGKVSNYVFGGGNEAGVGSATVSVSGGGIGKGLYGGCNTSGIVAGDASVSITGGAIGAAGEGNAASVYGGGLGEATKVRGDVTVEINTSETIYGDVYGGSAKGLVNCTDDGTAQYSNSKTDVTLTDGTIVGNIYGGGHGLENKDAHVWGPVTVTLEGGSVANVFGGNNLKGTPKKSVVVDIKDGIVSQDVYGGGNFADVAVATQVTVEGGEVHSNVYGGGAFASTGATTVNILDGIIGTSGNSNTGNIYGGGLGDGTHAPEEAGVVTVNIGAPAAGNINTLTTHTGSATILGSVYGCNNTAGSPQDDVFVNVYGTAAATAPAYAIANVFGGGNLADYSATGKTAKVMVYGCQNAIERVFGGGNAAAAPHVETVIQGGRFDYVFGGGNGESGNAADINEGVRLEIHGGDVNHYFAGSNMTGSITGGSEMVVDNDGPCGSLTVDEFFCGGNYASIVGDVNTVIQCGSDVSNMKINSLYGGCNMADIEGDVNLTVRGGKYRSIFGGSKGKENGTTPADAADISGNVTLNIYGGTVGYVENNVLYEGNIFGGSNYNGSIGGKITVNVEDKGGDCALDIEHANVFGGGNIAIYAGEPEVNIKHCTVNNVYGGGNGIADSDQTKGSTGSTTLNLGDADENHTVTVLGNVYGGGNAAKVNGTTTVLVINDNTTVNKVFGGGNAADVTGNATVTVNNGTINGGSDATHNGVYGGCNDKGNVGGLITLNMNNGTFGSTGSNEKIYVHGGGYGQSTTTSGSVEVNVGNGSETPVIYGDVYGGSALGKVNSNAQTVNANAHTYVNLVKGTINGSLYGGGLGDGDHAADVYSPVTVTVTKGTVTGAVYGCNNINGSPKSTVAVTVNGTDAGTNSGNTKEYAIKGVYGGGNQAHYIPATIEKGYPLVTINGCEGTTTHTSIEDVFGGGRAAGVSQTKVVIWGGDIKRAFAGGDGDNTANTPAHVGYYNKTLNSVENPYEQTATNGVGETNILVKGGTIGQVFGGTNKNGTIREALNVNVTKDGDCPMHIEEVYGGGNEAASLAGNITVGCTGSFTSFDDYEGIENLYGGANDADVSGNITLNISKGNINNVFGGNNIGHSITGNITVNVDKDGDCLHVGNVYGGGNLADYSNTGAYPEVNIKNGTVANVFGGGKGLAGQEKATVTGNPKVTIGNADNSGTAMVSQNVYGGGDAAKISGNTVVKMQGSNSSALNIFGGGNAADVTGTASVTVDNGTLSGDTEANHTGVYGGCNTKGNVGGVITVAINGGTLGVANNTNKKAYVHGGGYGDQTSTGDAVSVTIDGTSTKIYGDVYGGSALGSVNDNAAEITKVWLKNGTVTGDVFGGGLGQSGASNVTKGQVNGAVQVLINGGTVDRVFGCNNENGAPKSTVQVDIEKTAETMVVASVYGGGNKASYAAPSGNLGYPVVNVKAGTVSDEVYGGGLGTTAVVTGNPQVTVNGANAAATDVYGGGSEASTSGSPKVTLTEGAVANVYGGGKAADVTGAPTVDIDGGTVSTGVYGGCNASGTVGGEISVNITGGVVGTDATNTANVHGGGYGPSTATGDAVTVTVGDGTSTPIIWGDVYGGSALGNVNDDVAELTKVWLKSGTVNGCLYGGGLGDDGNPAQVNGKVEVIVDGGSVMTTTNTSKTSGAVFGCNNVNGTPKGTVEVKVNKTAATIINEGVKTYALQGVYGGGNLAHYVPTTANNGYPQVTIDCNTSIKDVFGGGNAAAVPQTSLIIKGGDIERVFAGGNGTSGAAHVGHKNKIANTTEDPYGAGTASATIQGGTIKQVFGGSNLNGVIRVTGALGVNKVGNCDMIIGEVYGGGNVASGAAATLNIGCTGTWTTAADDPVNNHDAHNSTTHRIGYELEGIGSVYGGANMAAVSNDIELNIVSGIIENVFGGNNQNGNISGKITVNIEKDNNASCANSWYVGNVYGGGNLAQYIAPSGSQNYPEVNIKKGTISGDVFGGGLGLSGDDGKVIGNPKVTISGTPTTTLVNGYVYGGGSQALTQGNPKVTLTDGATTKVFGGGKAASVTGNPTVEINGGKVSAGVYGGCDSQGNVSGKITVNVNGGVMGSQENLALADPVTVDVYGGGFGEPTTTSGDVEVNINNGTIYGDVYGGSALGSVNTQNGSNTTTVNIMGGTLETHITTTPTAQAGVNANVYNGGNVYGGGLGASGVEAKVNGTVTVNIGSGTLAATDPDINEVTHLSGTATIKGNVYGCNNTNGSPQQNVTVNVFKTAHPDNYVLPNVFGGGNKADFTVNGKTANVNVYSCANIIGRVFGGGNAAATNSVRTMIQGGTISEVYGGGNGEVSAANVYGTATLNIHGGEIGQNFAGSNQQGTILQGSTVTVDDLGPCATTITEFFCGGNFANYEGNINATIKCDNNSMNITNLYGGCNLADVVPNTVTGEPGNIHLKVYGGTFKNVYGGSKGDLAGLGSGHTDKPANIAGDVRLDVFGGTIDTVFGGCNINGNIAGKIIVNVIDTVGNCPLVVHNVYGGGRDASYTPSTTAALAGQYPEVNIIHGTISKQTGHDDSGNVFGGGFGASAEVNSTPKVSIGYAASMSSYLPTNYAITENNRHAVVEGNVYGGGDLAPVAQGTVVTIQKANTSVEGDVFGGGNEADVTALTTVNIAGGTVAKDVYGGGALANTGGTFVTLAGGNVTQDIYGGGLGDGTHAAAVNGDVKVMVNSGTVRDVFGCNNLNGAPTGTDTVFINNSVTRNVYGGGNQAACSVSPVVYVNNGTVGGNVFGGGLGASAVVTGTPKVTIGDLAAAHASYLATVTGDVYGGGDAANVEGTTTVLVQKCNTVINGDVYGGGNAADVKKNGSTGGTTSVTVTGGTINNSGHTNAVFGGGHGDKDHNVSANVETSTNVTVNGGMINQVFGGSNSMGTINGGNAGGINVLVNKTDNSASSCPLHITELYGGGNYAASQAGSIDIRCTGTVENANEGIGYVYGGANRADVTGPINLTIREGHIDNVFGGNNNSGTITGDITVNIEKKASPCVWEIGNVYGGGNLAEYSGTPKVTVKNGTVANVFGGGNGDPTSTTQEPGQVGGSDVTIGDANADYCAGVTGNVFGGGNAAKVSGDTKVTYNDAHTSSQVGNLFGGGNAAGVTGKTEVFLTKGKVVTNIYGGCNTNGTVGSTSTVTLTGGTVQGSVFGGGFGSGTEITGKATVDISGSATRVDNDVYGGGDNGQVKGGTEVNIH